MKRKLLAALSATSLFLVSCGGSSDAVDAYIEIANKGNCTLAPLAAFYASDEVALLSSNEDFAPYVEEHQMLNADAADGLDTLIQEMEAVEWPDDVVDEVDVYLTNVEMTVAFLDEMSTAETYDEVMEVNMNVPTADMSTSEAVKAKLGVTDEQVPQTSNLEELIDSCN